MRNADDSRFNVSEGAEKLPVTLIQKVFDAVWRFDFSAPGFCVLELGASVDSHDLRSRMLDLKERLSEIGSQMGRGSFAYRSIGRFDQQVTTKFHLDSAPEQSLLMLGYEPSKIQSRLSLADYTRCAYDLGIEPRRFLDEFNPMFSKGEQRLKPYGTELPQPAETHSRILLINNSSLPFSEARRNPLGVLHKAEILNADASQPRVVNSMMLAASGPEEANAAQLQAFVVTNEVSKKFYE